MVGCYNRLPEIRLVRLDPRSVLARLLLNLPGGFTLQSALNAAGPYADIAAPPLQTYSYDTTSQPQQFFRLKN